MVEFFTIGSLFVILVEFLFMWKDLQHWQNLYLQRFLGICVNGCDFLALKLLMKHYEVCKVNHELGHSSDIIVPFVDLMKVIYHNTFQHNEEGGLSSHLLSYRIYLVCERSERYFESKLLIKFILKYQDYVYLDLLSSSYLPPYQCSKIIEGFQ